MKVRAAIVAVALVAAFAPIPPRLVDRVYSNGLFAALQPPVTSLANGSPYAWFDAMVAGVAAGWLALAIRDLWRRRGRLRGIGRVVLRTVVWTAALYLVFLVMWGFNYRRVPLAEQLPYDARTVSPEAALILARTSVDALNRLYAPAHAAGWVAAGAIDRPLAEALARADREVGGGGRVVAGRPKFTLFNWYFRRAAVDGMTDPYFLETMVASELLPFERPFVLAHEWSHLAGRADEGDANFLGWLACVQSEPPHQYSGWLFLYSEVMAGVRGPERGQVMASLDDGPRADLTAIRARLTRDVSPQVSAAGWAVYDRYLKANRVQAGAASYAQVVRLVLGTKFENGWHVSRQSSVDGRQSNQD